MQSDTVVKNKSHYATGPVMKTLQLVLKVMFTDEIVCIRGEGSTQVGRKGNKQAARPAAGQGTPCNLLHVAWYAAAVKLL
jgi:hypothetical protein